jgi:phospholipase C
MDHTYEAEQKAYHGGLMDKFVESTGATEPGCDPKKVLGYFDGETVTALWNYAAHFTMSDAFFNTTFGPSTPGAINLVSGQTHGAVPAELREHDEIMVASGTLLSDPDPEFDDCSYGPTVRMTGKNIGHRMNEAGVTWGFFEAGFRPTERQGGKAVCGLVHNGANGKPKKDYIPHHEPFQYYKATANPHHLAPTSAAKIGRDDRANHQYDLEDFWAAAGAGALPQVSFLKAPAYQDGHAGYSDPLSEQRFLVDTINRIQKLKEWKDAAVVVTYDDSDGWYDHVMPPIVNQSSLAGIDQCGTTAPGAYPGRCGYGPRLPFLLISPYAKSGWVDHAVTDQTSVLRFIEENWGVAPIGDHSFDAMAGAIDGMLDFSPRSGPNPPLFLDPESGKPAL